MYKITIKQTGQEVIYESGKSLLEILLLEKIFINNPCNGKGVCGKCKVRIISGNAGEIKKEEICFLKQEEINSGVRLSCMVYPNCDLEIELLQKERNHKILTSGYKPMFERDLDISKKVINIEKPSLENPISYEAQICKQLPGVNVPINFLRNNHFTTGTYTAALYTNKSGKVEIISLEVGDTTTAMYGIAIDIGTTTVVASLVDMIEGEEIAISSMINAQKQYGLDVLTRITYELENPEDGAKNLQKAIVDSINDMIFDMCVQEQIVAEQIYEIVVSANCTMMHMLLGIDATSIGKSPYAPMFVKAKDIPAVSIGIHAAEGARLYCLPSVSSYIGADIVAGAYVCELYKADTNILFIDIGTNGEIVFANRGKLLCCSCAAGPALEGMNISSGMRASEGAIEDVTISEDGIHLKVIGGGLPSGVCGSGILSAVKELVRTGMVRKDGSFVKINQFDKSDYRYSMIQLDGRKREFIMSEEPKKLLITQGDIRQVQLAKGAILSGFYALLKKTGVAMEDLDKILIAGQFGAHLSVDSLTGTGILPKSIGDKIVYVGNTSKTGAYMALMSKTIKEQMDTLGIQMEYMELGTIEGYERLFADCLLFPTI